MKERDIERLKSGDKVVFVKGFPKSKLNKIHDYKIGDELIFDTYDFTIDAMYFIREDRDGCYYECRFNSKICRYISDKIEIRDKKIDKLLNICVKRKLNG